MHVLAGDVGGTNLRLALVEVHADRARVLADETLPSRESAGLQPAVGPFLDRLPIRPAAACFGVPGAVRQGVARITNLPWLLDVEALEAGLGLPITLINDFEAVGYGIRLLPSDDLVALQIGDPDPEGAIGVLGAGTGLGQGFLVRGEAARYRAHPSEGGHATFSARSEREWRLAVWLARRFGHVSFERILSGPGLVSVYEFLCGEAGVAVRSEMSADATSGDPGARISELALDGSDPIARDALDLFVSVYGSQAGNLALTVLATGGIYLAGGIAPRILPRLAGEEFLTAFRGKGRMQRLLERIPVQVILNPDVGLLGAAAVAAEGR